MKTLLLLGASLLCCSPIFAQGINGIDAVSIGGYCHAPYSWGHVVPVPSIDPFTGYSYMDYRLFCFSTGAAGDYVEPSTGICATGNFALPSTGICQPYAQSTAPGGGSDCMSMFGMLIDLLAWMLGGQIVACST